MKQLPDIIYIHSIKGQFDFRPPTSFSYSMQVSFGGYGINICCAVPFSCRITLIWDLRTHMHGSAWTHTQGRRVFHISSWNDSFPSEMAGIFPGGIWHLLEKAYSIQEMVSSTLFMSEENRFFDSPEVNHQNEGRRSWISCPRAVYLESDLNICQANSHGGTTYW